MFDLDQTLIDTTALEPLRMGRRWGRVRASLAEVRPYPGIPDLLEWLTGEGVATAVVTSSPDQYASLVLGVVGWAPDVLVGYHATRLHKPDPAPLLHAVRLLGVQPAEAAYVGDDVADTVAARRAGVLSIGATWGARSPQDVVASCPDACCSWPADLRRCLASLVVTPSIP